MPVDACRSRSGTAATFGAFTPGVARDYTANMTATVISTAGNAALTVVRPERDRDRPSGQRHASRCRRPLQVKATSPVGTGGALADVGGFASPTPLLTYSGPVSNDAVTIGFQQHVDANDALRTGTLHARRSRSRCPPRPRSR